MLWGNVLGGVGRFPRRRPPFPLLLVSQRLHAGVMKLHNALLAFLAVFVLVPDLAFANGRPNLVQEFDSGGLVYTPDMGIPAEGAGERVRGVRVEIEFDRAFTGSYLTGQGALLQFDFQPSVLIGLGNGGIVHTLPNWHLNWVARPGSFMTYASSVATTSIVLDFTTEEELAQFISTDPIFIDLDFAGGYTMHVQGGSGQSTVWSGYSHRSSISYFY